MQNATTAVDDGLPVLSRVAEIDRATAAAASLGAAIDRLGPDYANREDLVRCQAEILHGATASIKALFELPRTPQNVRAQAQAILALHGPEWGTEDGDWMEWMTRRALENVAC